MSYSQEEIEKKRLLALQRKQQAQIKNKSFTSPNASTSTKIFCSNNNAKVNENKAASIVESFYNGPSKLDNLKSKFGNDSFKNNGKFNKQTERFNPMSSQKFFGQKSVITGKCYMISDDRFALETSVYFPPLVETLKSVPSRCYDMKTKTWNFLLKDYETLMEKIINLKTDLQITGIPKAVLQIFRRNDSSNNVKDMDLSNIDPQLVESLMPFQREGVCYGISKEGRCMIADDMGLGKTIQALGIAHYFKDDWPLLIAVPSSVRYQWAEAIYTFLPSVPTHYVYHFMSTKDFMDDAKIVITTYDLIVRATGAFKCKKFGFVILDESHALKSAKTARFKAAQCIVSQARRVILLTGTPALSRPIELFTQINLIMPKFMGIQEYGIRYCAGELTTFGWNFLGSSNMQELQLLIKQACVLRRLKAEVLNQLPTKKREVIILNSDLISAGTKEMLQMAKMLQQKTLKGVERHSTLLQYYNESSIAKLKAICDYVSKIFENKQKCVIFAHHQTVIDEICKVADFLRIKYIKIDGRTNPERRKCLIDQFQESDSYIAAILSITAANAGITLTAAKLVVFAELFWNPGILCQAEDRVHRIGQDDNVVIQYLVAKQTADDYLWPLIQKKMNVLNEVGLDQDFSLKDANVTNQILNNFVSSSKQRTLDFYGVSSQCEDSDVEILEIDESVTKDVAKQSQSPSSEQFEDILNIDDEVLEFCDWNDME